MASGIQYQYRQAIKYAQAHFMKTQYCDFNTPCSNRVLRQVQNNTERNMGDTIRQLDYERRSREWLKRRTKVNIQPRECHQNFRLSQKREEKILAQKLVGVDLAIRLLGSDYIRDVRTVEKFHRTILTRSVKFHDELFKNVTLNGTPNSSGRLERISRIRGRRFRQKTISDDENVADALQRIVKQTAPTDFIQKKQRAPCIDEQSNDERKFTNIAPSRDLFVISENNDNAIRVESAKDVPSVDKGDSKHPSNCHSEVAAPVELTTSEGDLGLLRSASFCIDDSSRSVRSINRQRRSSVPLQRPTERFPLRPTSSGAESATTRPASASSQMILYDYVRPSSAMSRSSSKSQKIGTNQNKSGLEYQRGEHDLQIALLSHSFRSMSCDITPGTADPDMDLNRPQTADATSQQSNRLYLGWESRSFKTLRDTYKGVYQEDLDPRTKRVTAMRLQENQAVQRLQTQVKLLCSQIQFIFPKKVN